MTVEAASRQVGCEGEGSGKVALVTGAARGLGRATALSLASAGADVIVHYNTRKDQAAAVVARIREMGRRSLAVQADVSSYEAVGTMVNKIMDEFGRIDVLINNAGVVKQALFVNTTEQEWDRIVATNLKGVFNCCKHVVPHMIAQRGGRIINISTLIALSGYRGNAAYSSSKAALLALTGTLAQELGKYEIRVNAVLPGHFHTEMTEGLDVPENEWQRILTRMPLGRFGKEDELADVVRFLAFRGDYVSGVALRVDGGWNP